MVLGCAYSPFLTNSHARWRAANDTAATLASGDGLRLGVVVGQLAEFREGNASNDLGRREVRDLGNIGHHRCEKERNGPKEPVELHHDGQCCKGMTDAGDENS